jgi:hypothetical protein
MSLTMMKDVWGVICWRIQKVKQGAVGKDTAGETSGTETTRRCKDEEERKHEASRGELKRVEE